MTNNSDIRKELQILSMENEVINYVVNDIIEYLRKLAKAGLFEATLDLSEYKLEEEQIKSVKFALQLNGINIKLETNSEVDSYKYVDLYWY